MSSSSPRSTSEPPAWLIDSPFHEVLVDDVARELPPDLCTALTGTTTVRDLNDWLAAAAMARWLSDDAHAQSIFRREIVRGPRYAGLSLATAVASRLAPPLPSREQRRLDLTGLTLQLAVAAAVLCARYAAIRGLVVGGLWRTEAWNPGWLTALVDLPLLSGEASSALSTVAVLGAAAVWHAFEAAKGPVLLEWVRQWPTRLRQAPALRSHRLDAFLVVWRLHAIALASAVTLRQLGRLHFEFTIVRATHTPSIAAIVVGALTLGLLVRFVVAPITDSSLASYLLLEPTTRRTDDDEPAVSAADPG